MGCAGSKGSAAARNNKAEADRHARRKKNNFRDSGLERTRKACVQQKKKLHHVEDPAMHKKEKIAKIQKAQKKKPTGPMGMTENELQKQRANLNHH
jgi:SUMO ligase MMS21 Smc5/6 complex component